MLTYASVELGQALNKAQVLTRLTREPFDVTYAQFLLQQIQTGQYDACIKMLIDYCRNKGKQTSLRRSILYRCILAPGFGQDRDIHETFYQQEYTESMLNANPIIYQRWLELQGLTGQPWQITYTENLSRIVIEIKYAASRQRAQVL